MTGNPDSIGRLRLVGVTGFEPVTSSLSVKCSNQLSYTPVPRILNRGQNGTYRTLLEKYLV